MQINIGDIMDDIAESYDEILSDDLKKRFLTAYNDNKNLSKSVKQVNNQISDDIPFPANTIKELILMSVSIAINSYHYQLREKLLEFNIDIGDLEVNPKNSDD